MATIKRFEDIEAWQKAWGISKKIHSLTHQKDFKKNFALVDQIRRSSGSVMDNIAGGYGRDGNDYFV